MGCCGALRNVTEALRSSYLRIAGNDVVIDLFKKKCMPVLLYGTEACPMKKSHTNSLQFVVNSCFSKIFNTRSKEVIEVCQHYFNCEPISQLISRRTHKFLCKYGMMDNLLCTTACSVL